MKTDYYTEQTRKVDKILKRLISGFFYISAFFARIILMGIMIVGSISSMILLTKLFPEIATRFYLLVIPTFTVLCNLTITLLKMTLTLLLVYFIVFFIVLPLIESYNNRRKNIEKRREKFLDELALKIKKRMKRK